MVRAEGEISNGDFFVPLFQSLCGGKCTWAFGPRMVRVFFCIFALPPLLSPLYCEAKRDGEEKLSYKNGSLEQEVGPQAFSNPNPLRSGAPVPSFDIEVTSHLPRYEKRKGNLICPIFLRKIKILSCAKSRSFFGGKKRHVGKKRM